MAAVAPSSAAAADISLGGNLAALRTDVLGSPTAAAAGQRTPSSSAKSRQLVYLGQLYGAEVVGRKCSVLHNRHGKQGFEKAQILDFDTETGQHKLRHHVDKIEEWLSLSDIKFKWSQVAAADAAPNPTFKAELSGDAAVGKRLRVYWPAMQKWYCGTVRAYDPATGLHTVYYKDGDQQSLMLRHEPIIWADDELAMQAEGSNLITWVTSNSDGWGSAAAGMTRAPSGSTAPAAAASAFQAPVAAPAGAGMIPVAATGAAAVGAPAAGGLFGGGSQHSGAPVPAAAGSNAGAGLNLGRSPSVAAAAAAAMHAAILRSVFPAAPAGRGRGRGHRGGGGRGVLGKHGRAEGASGDGAAAAKRRRGPAPQKLRQAAMAAAAAAAIPNKHLAVNCRVGVYWRLDKAFYTGKVKAYSPQTGKFTVQYDDGQCEALLLERERFIWHAPRGMTAGYKPALHGLMQQLGAEGLKALPQDGPDGRMLPLTPAPEAAPHPPSTGPGAVGWRVQLYWPADGAWHEGEVLSYNESKRLHHVLYLDGEEEWLDLSNEMVVWSRATRGGAISAGHFLSSEEVPKGREALGWHVSVYWTQDKQFYPGQVTDIEASSGKHKVLYHDGETELLNLRNECVIWRLPPNEASEGGEDDVIMEDTLDSDDSIDIMEVEEVTDDMTDDDTPAAARKKGSKRIRRRMRTRKSRMSRLGFESDNSSEPGRILQRQQHAALWGAGTAVAAAAGGGSSSAHNEHQPGGLFGGPLDAAAAPTTATGAHFSAARPPLAVPSSAGADAPVAATGAAGKGLMGRQPSGLAGNGLLGHYSQQQQPHAAGGAMRAPQGPVAAAGAGLARAGTHGGLARASSSGLLAGVSSSALLSLNLPAINIRRSGPSGDGTGSPLIRQSLDTLQLSVRIAPGGTSGATAAGPPAAAAGAAGAAGSIVPASAAVAATVAPGGATAAALQPVLQHLPPGRRHAAQRLQRKMDRLDMILSKLTSTANMYGWRLEPQEPLPPLLPPIAATHRATAAAAAGGTGKAAGGAGHRPRSTPTSPTGAAGGSRHGLGSPRHSSGPLSPRAAAARAAMANNAGSLPTSPRSALGPISPTAAAAAAAPAAAGRPVAVHKTCAVKSRPVGGAPANSNGSGAQRLKAWSYGLTGQQANQPSSSSTGQQAGIGAGTAGGSGELTSVLASALGGGQQQQQQQGTDAAARQQQVATAAALQHVSQALAMPRLSAASLAALTATPGGAAAAAAAAGDASLAASAARAAVEAVLTSGVNPVSLLQVSNPAVPSVSRAADEVVYRLQALAQLSSPSILQQQLQSWQSAAAAAAAANAAAAAAASAAVSESAAAARRPVPVPAAAAAATGAAAEADGSKAAPLAAAAAQAPAVSAAAAPAEEPAAAAAGSGAQAGLPAPGDASQAATGGPPAAKAKQPAGAAAPAKGKEEAPKVPAAAAETAVKAGLTKAAAALAAVAGPGKGAEGGKGAASTRAATSKADAKK